MLDLHLKNKGIYSPIRHAVSDYGVGEYKYLFNWAGIVSTFRNIFLIGALICWNYEAAFKEKAIWLLVLALVGYFGVMVFPTDIEGSHKTISGRLHLLFAICYFTVYRLGHFSFSIDRCNECISAFISCFLLGNRMADKDWFIWIGRRTYFTFFKTLLWVIRTHFSVRKQYLYPDFLYNTISTKIDYGFYYSRLVYSLLYMRFLIKNCLTYTIR